MMNEYKGAAQIDKAEKALARFAAIEVGLLQVDEYGMYDGKTFDAFWAAFSTLREERFVQRPTWKSVLIAIFGGCVGAIVARLLIPL